MDTRHADAMVLFADRIDQAVAMANRADLTDGELAKELRRIADEMDAETRRQMKINRAR